MDGSLATAASHEVFAVVGSLNDEEQYHIEEELTKKVEDWSQCNLQ
jgi:hypothetical protein